MAADGFNLAQAGTMSPEDYAQQQQLNRQQQMAQLLMQQGTQQPQGQMVSGRYVPTSFFQNLLPIANIAASQYLGNKAETEGAKLAEQLRQRRISEAEAISGAKTPEEQLKIAMGGYSPLSQQLASKLIERKFREPKWEKSERTVDGIKESGFVNVNSDDPSKTFVIGSRSPDIDYAKGVYEGYLPQTGGQMPMGVNNQSGASNFGNAVNKVLNFEGGYVASDGRSNAPTNFGINQKANPDIDVKNLTKDKAINIYKDRYWNAIGGDSLAPKTAEIAFDAAVNQGVDYAKGLIQKTGGDPTKMLQQRAMDYQALVQKDPSQAQYLSGWMNRLTSLSQGGGVQGAPNVGGTDTKYMPSTMPQYKYDPMLSPKKNQEQAEKFSEANQKAVKNAEDSFGLLKGATQILNTNAPSSGGLENFVTGTREFFGGGGEASQADAELKVLGETLTQKVPRFEGPQSDKDTASYRAAAGDVGNANKPIATRLASIKRMIELNKKYYPNGDWADIDTGGAVVQRNFLGGYRGLGAQVVSPEQFAEGLSKEDKEAFKFVRENPKDPRSAKIKAKLGID